jgi:hypothetical protein
MPQKYQILNLFLTANHLPIAVSQSPGGKKNLNVVFITKYYALYPPVSIAPASGILALNQCFRNLQPLFSP